MVGDIGGEKVEVGLPRLIGKSTIGKRKPIGRQRGLSGRPHMLVTE